MDMGNLLSLALQGLGALVLCFMGMTLKKISGDNEENAKSILQLAMKVGDLALKMSEHYVTKDEWSVTRERVHDLTGTVTELRTEFRTMPHRRGGD